MMSIGYSAALFFSIELWRMISSSENYPLAVAKLELSEMPITSSEFDTLKQAAPFAVDRSKNGTIKVRSNFVYSFTRFFTAAGDF